MRSDRQGCAWGDVNQDGRPDVYCTLGAGRGTTVKANQLWIQQPDGTFVNRAATFGVTDPYGRGRNATFIDVNHDRWPDLFVANTYPRSDGVPTPNRLFINVDGTRFRSAPEFGVDKEVGGTGIIPGCVQADDFDRDGWQDLLVCGKGALRLYRNVQGESFRNVTAGVGISGFALDAELVDVGLDGDLDLTSVSPRTVQVRLNQGGVLSSPVWQRSLSGGRSMATGDVNADRFPDFYVLQGRVCATCTPNPPDIMLLNAGGRSFSQTWIPTTSAGCGAWVVPLDYDRNGTKDFVVSNGGNGYVGPVQLISFPAS